MKTGFIKLSDKMGRGFLAVFFCLSPLASLQAQLMTYTDPTAWAAAAPGAGMDPIPDVGDENPPSEVLLFGPPNGGLDLGDVNVSINVSTEQGFGGGSIAAIGAYYYSGGYPFPGSSPPGSYPIITPVIQTWYDMVLNFSSPQTAFAVQYGAYGQDPINFYLGTGDSYFQNPTTLAGDPDVATVEPPDVANGFDTPDFFGFTSSTPFTSILILAPDEMNVSSLSYSTTVLPEPGAVSLLGVSGLAFALFRRPRQFFSLIARRRQQESA